MKKKFLILSTIILSLLVIGSITTDKQSGESQELFALEQEKIILNDQIRELELQLAKEQSLETIYKKASELGMVELSEVWYIKDTDPLASR